MRIFLKYISNSILSGGIQIGHNSKCVQNDEVYQQYLRKRHPQGQTRKDLFLAIEEVQYQRSYLSFACDLGQ